MAYYENAPKKRGKAARETSEVWEEEGSRYTRSGSEKRGTGAKKRTEGGETRGRTAGDSRGRAAGDSRSRTRKPAERGARESAPAGRNGTPAVLYRRDPQPSAETGELLCRYIRMPDERP